MVCTDIGVSKKVINSPAFFNPFYLTLFARLMIKNCSLCGSTPTMEDVNNRISRDSNTLIINMQPKIKYDNYSYVDNSRIPSHGEGLKGKASGGARIKNMKVPCKYCSKLIKPGRKHNAIPCQAQQMKNQLREGLLIPTSDNEIDLNSNDEASDDNEEDDDRYDAAVVLAKMFDEIDEM
jgi:hypothetical protein